MAFGSSARPCDPFVTTCSYRRTPVRVIYAIFAMFWLLMGLLELQIGRDEGDLNGSVGVGIGIAMCTVSVVVLGRVGWVGIFADGVGVSFKNFVFNFRHRWCEIDRFESPRPWGTFRKTGLAMVLIDGRRRTATLFARGRLDSGKTANSVVAELQGALLHHRSTCEQCGPGEQRS